MKLAWGVVLLFVIDVSAAPDPDPLVDATVPAPPSEARKPRAITLPALPDFVIPRANPDGTHTPREIRLRSKQILDREIAIKGVITWVYDCVTANRGPNETAAQVQKRIDADPTLCERPKFYVGDSSSTSPDSSIWVVDVPRVYNKLELARIKKQERTDPGKCEPDGDPKKKVCPPYRVGDEVEVVGKWALTSPHSERNSDGLLVYARMKNVTQNWSTPGRFARPANLPPPFAPGWPPIGAPKPPVAKPVGKIKKSVRDKSLVALDEATRAAAANQWNTAIERYTKATDTWPENAAAWYGVAVIHGKLRDWTKAADAAERAARADPRIAMYHLLRGQMLYEKAIQDAREDLARRQNRKPDEVIVDHGTINFANALGAVQVAAALDPDLWRAHYLIGTMFRHLGNARSAADELAKALVYQPAEAAPWIALVELYRAWDYRDQAIAVAEQAVNAPLDPGEKGWMWFALGMAYDDKRLDDKALDAFTKALDLRKDLHGARFMRGQAYFRKGDHAKAKPDLEAYLKTASAGTSDFYKQQAARMLMDIAAKAAGTP